MVTRERKKAVECEYNSYLTALHGYRTSSSRWNLTWTWPQCQGKSDLTKTLEIWLNLKNSKCVCEILASSKNFLVTFDIFRISINFQVPMKQEPLFGTGISTVEILKGCSLTIKKFCHSIQYCPKSTLFVDFISYSLFRKLLCAC